MTKKTIIEWGCDENIEEFLTREFPTYSKGQTPLYIVAEEDDQCIWFCEEPFTYEEANPMCSGCGNHEDDCDDCDEEEED